jgi:hypothetical protein
MAKKTSGGDPGASDRKGLVHTLQQKDLQYQSQIKILQAKRRLLGTTLREVEAGLFSMDIEVADRW